MKKSKGLGERFIAAVSTKLKTIANNPEIFGSKDDLSYREALLDTFPYINFYKIYQQK